MSDFETIDLNSLPYGNPDFSDIRESNKIYVDKTALIAKIAGQKAPVFFSRPRRFGKSLLINTLASLFADGLEYFHGLDIEKIWKDKTYHVVRLDFSRMAEKKPDMVRSDLGEAIIKKFNMEGIVSQLGESGIRSPDGILEDICCKLQNNSVVLLIDEYDAPLTHHIDNYNELKEIKSILNSFYLTIKQYTGKFRLIFITGVTRSSNVSIFSAFNNLKDISFRKEFNSLLGFTKGELEYYFDRYIENAGHALNMKKEDVYKRIQQYYDGYIFSPDAEQSLYNPWSIINFLDSPQEGFKNYWFETGGTPSIIMQYLKIGDSSDFLDYNKRDVSVNINKFLKKYEITDIPREILLYQAGYFSICDEHDGTVRLIFPNVEVEESLLLLYLEENKLEVSKKLHKKIKNIERAIDSRDLIYIINIFNLILNECASSSSKIFDDERAVRDIIYAALIQTPSIQQIKERDSAKGKSDLELITSQTYMIIEFKRTYSTRGPKASLKKAVEQIKENRYGLLFSQDYSLYRVAMVISTEERRILQDFCQEVI